LKAIGRYGHTIRGSAAYNPAAVKGPQHVFLIPGFFGFDDLGDLAYFAHVERALVDWFRTAGIDGRVHAVGTPPTASLRQRALVVLRQMEPVLAQDDGPAHLVGHSSGGLDARLVVTPDLVLPGDQTLAVEPLARRVRTVVSVATPHYGTPVAAFFSSLLGGQLLAVLSLATSTLLRTGRLPADVLVRLTTALVRLAAGREADGASALARLHDRILAILASLGPERRAGLEQFAAAISRDQDLLLQITPAAIDVFNASTQDRAGVRYGSVVTRTRPPNLRSFLSAGFSPSAHASHTLYVCLGQLAARVPADRLPVLTPDQRQALIQFFGAEPGRRANDGMVPTLSQVWGEVLVGAWADHLDVIGHFADPAQIPPHYDWLTSGSGFSRADFLRTWSTVASFIARA
jgi:hypothetical protein